MIFIGIDPGQNKSGFVVCNEFKPIDCGIEDNEDVRELLINANIVRGMPAKLIIEKPICRKWSGSSVSETAIWAGIFQSAWPDWRNVELLTRQKVRMRTVGKKATDAKIKRYLIDRFPQFVDNCFKNFRADIWQAYALVVVYLDGIGGVYVDAK